MTETDGDDFSVVVAEVQGSKVVPVLFPKAPVCEKTTAL